MGVVGGLYSGIKYYSVSMGSAGAMDDFLESLVNANKQDAVVSLFMMPSDYVTSGDTAVSKRVMSFQFPTHLGGSAVGWTYTPRNKKLLTYPYNFFAVDTLNDSHVYRWEWFAPSTGISFTMSASMTPNPEIAVQPNNYNGSSGPNVTEQVTMTGFPQCAWPIDTYMAWLAQKATGTALNIAAQAVGGVASAFAGNAVGVAGAALGIASTVNNAVIEATAGNRTRGNQSGSVNTANGQMGVYYRAMGVTEEYARMIDDFFDVYGYSYGRIEVPQRHVRQNWTYVKTKDCKVFGDIPEEARVKIQEIHDAGITYWSNPDSVGNYALSNAPL